MLVMKQEQIDVLAGAGFVRRMAQMLIDAGSVPVDVDFMQLCAEVAVILDYASERGIQSERLLGMVVLLRLADRIDPFVDPRYAQILLHTPVAEDDRAHLVQIIRMR